MPSSRKAPEQIMPQARVSDSGGSAAFRHASRKCPAWRKALQLIASCRSADCASTFRASQSKAQRLPCLRGKAPSDLELAPRPRACVAKKNLRRRDLPLRLRPLPNPIHSARAPRHSVGDIGSVSYQDMASQSLPLCDNATTLARTRRFRLACGAHKSPDMFHRAIRP